MCGSLATSMELKQQILHYYRVEEKGLREIARLCHKAYLVNMTGQSYRVREMQNMLKRL